MGWLSNPDVQDAMLELGRHSAAAQALIGSSPELVRYCFRAKREREPSKAGSSVRVDDGQRVPCRTGSSLTDFD